MEKIALFWNNNPLRTILGRLYFRSTLLRRYSTQIILKPLLLESIKYFVVRIKDKKKRNTLFPISYSLFLSSGFTLIELVTAIGILAILATVAITVLNPLEQFNKAADAKRKADLAQIQRGLEVYYQDFHHYPPTQQSKIYDKKNSKVVEWGTDWRPYMDVLPVDSKASKNYAYWTDDVINGGQSYYLYASLDRGGKDPQACNSGAACTNASLNGLLCGANNTACTYGVTSPNVSP